MGTNYGGMGELYLRNSNFVKNAGISNRNIVDNKTGIMMWNPL